MIINKSKEVYYPNDLKAGGIANSDKAYSVPKDLVNSGGSGGGSAEPLIVNIEDDTLDRTWQEIHVAFPNVILRDAPSDTVGEYESLSSVMNVNKINGPRKKYSVEVKTPSSAVFLIYITEDPNGYPSIPGGGIE